MKKKGRVVMSDGDDTYKLFQNLQQTCQYSWKPMRVPHSLLRFYLPDLIFLSWRSAVWYFFNSKVLVSKPDAACSMPF